MVEVELEWSGEGTQVHVSGEFTDWQPRQPENVELLTHFKIFRPDFPNNRVGNLAKFQPQILMSSGIINLCD
jgi:hypothetical protein